MPEGRFLLRDPLVMMESPVNADDNVFLYSTAAKMNGATVMTATVRAMKTDSASSLPDIPEIVIPPPLFNPLPLQCLAANALPDEVKSEIESVITLYSADSAGSIGDACDDASVTRRDASAEEDDSLASSGETAEVLGDDCSADSRNAIAVRRITLRRDSYTRELVNDLGIGAHITGGLKCDGCGRLHAVVTAITGVCSEELHEGLCVVEWCGKLLEGATYEEVRRALDSTDDQQEIELAVKQCSKLKWPQRGCGFLAGRFATLRADVRRKKRKGKHTDVSHVTPSDNCMTPTDDHVTTSNDHVTVMPGPSSANMETKQFPAPTLSLPTSSSPLSSLEEPSRSSSSLRPPANQRRPRPRSITLPASRTVEGTERRSAVPDISLTDDFGDFFASLPNGMVELSFEYKCAEESLEVNLHQVKVQSSTEVGSSSDVFINTYLIPDERGQGVRSCKVASRNYSVEKPSTYTIKEDELDTVALRVILWEAKNSAFQGEVLLSLSDSEIVNLSGKPTWFTICSEDPNLPCLPKPVHYKQKQRLENLLAQALSYLKQHTFKLSSTQQQGAENPLASSSASSVQEKPGQTATIKRRGASKRQRQQKATRFGTLSKVPKILDVLSQAAQLEFDTDASGKSSDENSKLARLSMVVKVLRDATTEEPPPDESLRIQKKQSRLSSILQVLQDAVMTDMLPPDPETPDTAACLQPPWSDTDSSISTLDHRSRERVSPATPSEEVKDEDFNNSFSVIPDLRDSLNANRRKINVYSFLKEIENLTNVEGGETGVTSVPNMGSGSDTSEVPQEEVRLGEGAAADTNNLLPSEKALHYKLLDDQGSADEVDVGDSGTVDPTNYSQLCMSEGIAKQQGHPRAMYGNKSEGMTHSACSHSSTEVSLQDKTDSPLPQVEITVASHFTTVYPSESSLPKKSNRPTLLTLLDGDVKKGQTRMRSRSVGSLENLESDDEECNCLQSPLTPSPTPTPVHPSSEQNRVSVFVFDDSRSKMLTPVCEESCADTDVSSLDVGARNSCIIPIANSEASLSIPGHSQHAGGEMLSSSKRHSWKKTSSLTKWKSFDDLLGSIKSKSKKGRSNSQEPIPPKSRSLKKMSSFPAYGCKTTGSVKLELQFSEHSSPVLHTLKLVDFVLMSSKSMSLDYSLKACLYHSSTGVRLLKKKTRVKMRNTGTDGCPLAVLQFDTDIPKLSLQVSLVGGGRLFSRKSVGHILIDLDSLNLNEQHSYTDWFQLTKVTSA